MENLIPIRIAIALMGPTPRAESVALCVVQGSGSCFLRTDFFQAQKAIGKSFCCRIKA